ncbi:MAG TPA: histidine phosphatase family protein, partial [Clostridiales bacterium]|nr:histidine phosphatase family protein [Clostridiales bacterium]
MVYLVRHGESVANLNKRFSGITDVELSENGREQARVAGQKLTGEKISHVYSSTLQRARDTAKIICDEIGFDKDSIIMEDCLVEVDFGVFENLTWDEIYANYREESEKWMEQQH